MLRHFWLHAALLFLSSNLLAKTTQIQPTPETGRVVKNLVTQIAYREPIPEKKLDYRGLNHVLHDSGPNEFHRFKVFPEPLRSRKIRIFEGGLPRVR
jgi:hypothetical protein